MIDFEKIPIVKKFVDILYDATYGLAKQYQKKTIELAKITAAQYYLQGMKALRKHLVAIVGVVFCAMLFVVTSVALPLALVAVAPIGATAKMTAIALIGVFLLLVSGLMIQALFSEKRWMEITGSKEWIEKLTNQSNSEDGQ